MYKPSPVCQQPVCGGQLIGVKGFQSRQGSFPPPGEMYHPAPAGHPPPRRYPPTHPQEYLTRSQGYPLAGGTDVPLTQQPMASGQPPVEGDWMNLPSLISANCPPGLEYLAAIDQLLVHQKVEVLEVLTGFETANKYEVKNSLGQKVFFAAEQSDCCTRNCCGPARPFGMKILDNSLNEVIHLERPLACSSCCFPCCLQKLEVFSPPGCLVGTVEQEWSICTPSFSIKNAVGDTMLLIKGSICTCRLWRDVKFKVLSKDGETVVGKISKQWGGIMKEMFTDADNFGITFPMDLDVHMKAVMLGACFLIDFMYFEAPPQ